MTEIESPKKKRGRESALDMVRSLGLVLIVVIAAWWLAQPNKEDKQEIRVIDSSASVQALLREAPGTPVPTTPVGWKPTVDDADADNSLRLGYVTPDDQYLEYAVSTSSSPDFLADITGKGAKVGDFTIDGVTWEQYAAQGGDAVSLVRTVGSATVVVGGLRETSSLEDIRTLAATVVSR